MNGFVLLKKEVKAILRTYQCWLVPLIFIFFGILSPVSAKFLPEILKAAMQSDAPQNMVIQIKIPEPTAADAYMQWLKNLSQFGMLTVILLSMGLISEEKLRGTLEMVATKPVSRTSIVLSKFASQTGLFALSIALGTAVCFLYTYLLFDNANLGPLIFSTLSFVIYAILILSITIFFSSLLKNPISAGGLGLISYFSLSITASLGHGFDKYTPGALATLANQIVAGVKQLPNGYPAITTSLLASLLIIAVASIILEKQEL